MTEEFDKLRKQLEQEVWPSLYLFKFITSSDNQKIALITNMFDETADIKIRSSSKGKYTSISIKKTMRSADSVMEIYEKTSKIDKVIII